MKCRRDGLDARERLLKYVCFTDSCWIWVGYRTKGGYGRIHYKGKHMSASRASYQIFNKIDVGGLHVLHKCNNPTCVNPAHLYVGTHQDNMRDWANNNKRDRRDRLSQAKLTYEHAELIRRLARDGVSQNSLSDYFKIHQSQISRILNYKAWN